MVKLSLFLALLACFTADGATNLIANNKKTDYVIVYSQREKYAAEELKFHLEKITGAPFEIMQAIKNDIHANASVKYPMLMSLVNGTFGYAPDNDSLQGLINGPGDSARYEVTRVPLIAGRLPYCDTHNELVRSMKEMEQVLDAQAKA